MDFFRICVKESKKKGEEALEVFPDFIVGRSKDLMVQGQAFYAVWDEKKKLWSRDEYDVVRLVDEELADFVEKQKANGVVCKPKYLHASGNGMWYQFKRFLKNVSDNSVPLDTKLTFANTETTKSDYASRRLSYDLAEGSIQAYDELVSKLYAPEEREKFEWAAGAIIAGDAKKIQKFLVFFGSGGTGKSTIMEILSLLFGGKVKDGGYVAFFDAKALVGNNNSFSTESFKDNPLVAIQHDGDLSKIEDNTKLNSIVSHEDLRINEKYKSTYDTHINAFLFMGTNKPVQISDAKSGMIRRLIDVRPTEITHDPDRYFSLMSQVRFELGAIAYHCLQVYKAKGKNAYSKYVPRNMMLQTNAFYNFIDEYFDIFQEHDGTTLNQAWELYKAWAEDSELGYKIQKHKFRDQLKNYFENFYDRTTIDGVLSRSVYKGFKAQHYKAPISPEKPNVFSLVMEETESLFDKEFASQPAQTFKLNEFGKEIPEKFWTKEERLINGEIVKPRPSQVANTVLSDIDTSEIHFVKVPEQHIVIDFDLTDDNGEKSLERNCAEAASWPQTYAEISKSGSGVHLHYNYEGDVTKLAKEYSPGIEVKTLLGDASLRRKLTKCNNVPVATISSGLPFKKEKPMLQKNTLQSEKGLRDLIARNLRKEIHPGTKPSIDFIHRILEDAHATGMTYDVTDLRPKIMAFANNSTNQALVCLKTVQRMKFKSDEVSEKVTKEVEPEDNRLVFFDTEVYPNLFVICWKYEGSPTLVRMINPTSSEVEQLFKLKLVGFNNRGYDNHIMWARYMGYTNEKLYELSQRIINDKTKNWKFGAAYNLSYADVFDFSVIKQGLKKWEIELGIPHMEMDIPWDQPVPDEKIDKVVDYCCNDVNALESVFNHLRNDFTARKILADLSGLSVNDTTRQHATKIIFGNERNPQREFVYTELGGKFKGYKFDPYSKEEKSTYRGEVVGEGGYVYAEPGIYEDVVLMDIASMHPTSIEQLNLFGPYTKKFSELKEARLAIKDGDLKRARSFIPWDITGKEDSKALSDALKLVINSVYGYTSATFPNPFKDPRNVDNIVAKRGALFMIDLKHFVQEKGFTVAHIKTDSIKIPNATAEIIEEVQEFGKEYGYTFNVEATYKKFCLVNDAVYIAREGDHWTATGAQFKHPYVFKKLFSGEPITFDDLCETKSVAQGAMYLDFGPEKATPATPYEGMHHVGKTGSFVPVTKKAGGGALVRVKDDKSYAVTGTKGYLWLESEMIKVLGDRELSRMPIDGIQAPQGTGSITDIVNMSYFDALAEAAIKAIKEYGSFEEFVK